MRGDETIVHGDALDQTPRLLHELGSAPSRTSWTAHRPVDETRHRRDRRDRAARSYGIEAQGAAPGAQTAARRETKRLISQQPSRILRIRAGARGLK
jgi:hypothetical protein